MLDIDALLFISACRETADAKQRGRRAMRNNSIRFVPLQAAHARVWELGVHLLARQAPLALGQACAEVGVDQLPFQDLHVVFETDILCSCTRCIAYLLQVELILFLFRLFSRAHRNCLTAHLIDILKNLTKWLN